MSSTLPSRRARIGTSVSSFFRAPIICSNNTRPRSLSHSLSIYLSIYPSRLFCIFVYLYLSVALGGLAIGFVTVATAVVRGGLSLPFIIIIISFQLHARSMRTRLASAIRAHTRTHARTKANHMYVYIIFKYLYRIQSEREKATAREIIYLWHAVSIISAHTTKDCGRHWRW